MVLCLSWLKHLTYCKKNTKCTWTSVADVQSVIYNITDQQHILKSVSSNKVKSTQYWNQTPKTTLEATLLMSYSIQ